MFVADLSVVEDLNNHCCSFGRGEGKEKHSLLNCNFLSKIGKYIQLNFNWHKDEVC